jgi:hypothetical protein
MNTITLFPTKKAALSAVGSLSDTSKMPGKSWGINADACWSQDVALVTYHAH